MIFLNSNPHSLFSQPLESVFIPTTETVESGVVFVYSGQGAMFPGMAKQFEHDPIFKLFFQIADSFCEKADFPKPSLYAFSPKLLTQEKRDRIESIALFTFQIALTHRLIQSGHSPQCATGHSFGEFAALVTSGALSFEQGLQTVLHRESLLPERNALGYMMAIAATKEEVAVRLQKHSFVCSNLNSPTQTVISLPWDQVIPIENTLRAERVKFSRLSSPQPFHSPWLQEQANQMSARAKETLPPTFLRRNFFSGVTKNYFPLAKDVKPDLEEALGQQLVSPVDFIQQICTLSKTYQSFIEVSPRPLLVNLIKSNLTSPSSKVMFALDLVSPEIKRVERRPIDPNTVSKQILQKINRIISKFTGYKVNEIKFEDRLQEDLGIDSIKTMEISVEILDELKLPREALSSLQRVKTVGEVAFGAQQLQQGSLTSQIKNSKPHFELFEEHYTPSPLPNFAFESRREKAFILVDSKNQLELSPIFELEPNHNLDIIFQFSHNQQISTFNLDFFDQFRQFCLTKRVTHKTRIAIISQSTPTPWARSLLAFLKSLKKEGQIGFVSHLVFEDLNISQAEQIRHARAELVFGSATDVKYNSHIERFELALLPATASHLRSINKGTLVAVGGAKGITFEVIKHLAKAGTWNLYLMGRSSASDPLVANNLKELYELSPRVVYLNGDARDKEALESLFHLAISTHERIDLAIQGAGVEISQTFIKRTPEQDTLEFQTKVKSTQNMITLTERFNVPLSLLFSSVISRFGNFGQAVYAAANAFSEGIWTSPTNSSTRLSVQWPPWDSVGMTEKGIVLDLLKTAGVALLPKEEAVAWVDQILTGSNCTVFDSRDSLLYQGPLNAWNTMDLPSARMFPNQAKLQLSFQLSIRDFPELKDHAIHGKAILPLALNCHWLISIGKKLTGTTLRLEDLRIFLPLELTTAAEEYFFLCDTSFSKNYEYRIELWKGYKLLAEGYLRQEVSLEYPQPVSLLTNKVRTFRVLQPEEFYNSLQLFHGPSFQFLRKVEVLTHSLLRAELIFPWKEKENVHPWWPTVSLIDSGFQLLGLWGIHIKQWRGLPIGFKSVSLPKELNWQDPVFWELINPHMDDSIIEGDLLLKNEEDLIIGEIKGAHYKKVN